MENSDQPVTPGGNQKPIENKSPEVKSKRYSLTKEEREHVGNMQSVMGILTLLRKGMEHSMTLGLMNARMRMGIKDSDAPEGYRRAVDFDPQTDEIVVTDVPLPKEVAEEEKNKKVDGTKKEEEIL